MCFRFPIRCMQTSRSPLHCLWGQIELICIAHTRTQSPKHTFSFTCGDRPFKKRFTPHRISISRWDTHTQPDSLSAGWRRFIWILIFLSESALSFRSPCFSTYLPFCIFTLLPLGPHSHALRLSLHINVTDSGLTSCFVRGRLLHRRPE